VLGIGVKNVTFENYKVWNVEFVVTCICSRSLRWFAAGTTRNTDVANSVAGAVAANVSDEDGETDASVVGGETRPRQ